MASTEEMNNEHIDLLEQEYPNLPREKLQHLYERFNGNLDQVIEIGRELNILKKMKTFVHCSIFHPFSNRFMNHSRIANIEHVV